MPLRRLLYIYITFQGLSAASTCPFSILENPFKIDSSSIPPQARQSLLPKEHREVSRPPPATRPMHPPSRGLYCGRIGNH
ncbi:hypothetical protein BKA67DRAFT_567510 [Truncatella angustata]|uniref:Secreted protein n=1 Tax=Truncatella angustata TaxID=152316 RepID=A0A9P8UIN8_9PEZI|nr:uncharacterized protein BKA67DRAFT_567510 [Truncatella angustata]KAH6652775.1 hypothetical protein BKA67DRAFT_567510 [Truncatella angustata]